MNKLVVACVRMCTSSPIATPCVARAMTSTGPAGLVGSLGMLLERTVCGATVDLDVLPGRPACRWPTG